MTIGTASRELPSTGVVLWNGPKQVDRYVGEHPALQVLAEHPTFNWIGEDTEPRTVATWARAAKGTPVPLVLYGIPNRDLGSYSAGGFTNSADYLAWVGAVAHHLGDAPAMIVVEPDALAQSLEMSGEERAARLRTLRIAVDILRENSPEARIYLDASLWVSPGVMADLLHRANVGRADGFSLNVAGHADDRSAFEYGDRVSAMTGGKQYVVDTSRNGAAGADETEWCNASGLGLGRRPGTLVAQHPRVDGLFWIKTPGVSDGTCNGGPPAGTFWLPKALELASNAAL
ncbi:MAG TPA: glycoside hydrolase family 6 protein [Streptomyces sp.]|uniref:glycoside hydrolase family 6 protein n=1 Tax=Streptomyces sp. TaxID=1931 RepID=UPI002D109706|nr:glycoside hydrolase family 6 protein [Streptomyces sp.]HWU05855.1 glycoside hydrolase family 6 protein [Streptomyces sp.]